MKKAKPESRFFYKLFWTVFFVVNIIACFFSCYTAYILKFADNWQLFVKDILYQILN